MVLQYKLCIKQQNTHTHLLKVWLISVIKNIPFFTAQESQDVSNYTLMEILCDKEDIDEEYVDDYDDSFDLDDNLSLNDSISYEL